MDNQLQLFYNNKPELNAVKQFLLDTVDKNALSMLYKGEDAKPSAEARKVVELAFSELREMFEPIKNNNNLTSR
jgi:hypothetical protein